MNDVWNLNTIYQGFEDPAFEQDLEALRSAAGEFNGFSEKLPELDKKEGLCQGILCQEKLTELAMKLATYAQLRQSTNTRDSQAGSRLGQVMHILSTTAGAEAVWKQWAAEIPELMTLVQEDALLKEYAFFRRQCLERSAGLSDQYRAGAVRWWRDQPVCDPESGL